MLIIVVEVRAEHGSKHLIRAYTMDHDDQFQRRVLGEQVRNAFEAGQCVTTYPQHK